MLDDLFQVGENLGGRLGLRQLDEGDGTREQSAVEPGGEAV